MEKLAVSSVRQSTNRLLELEVAKEDGIQSKIILPVRISNPFECIPYQHALENSTIGYKIEYVPWQEIGKYDSIGPYNVHKLEILDGPLKGKNYEFSEELFKRNY